LSKHVHTTSIVREVVVVFGVLLGKVSKNCCEGGDCSVVTTHTHAIIFVVVFSKLLAFHVLSVFCLNVEALEVLWICNHFSKIR